MIKVFLINVKDPDVYYFADDYTETAKNYVIKTSRGAKITYPKEIIENIGRVDIDKINKKKEISRDIEHERQKQAFFKKDKGTQLGYIIVLQAKNNIRLHYTRSRKKAQRYEGLEGFIKIIPFEFEWKNFLPKNSN